MWEIAEFIIACGFDTTSTNRRVSAGGCKILQDLLNRQILWLACRHHIVELVVRAAFHCIFGKTKSPVEPFCTILREKWSTINTQDILLPNIPPCYANDTSSILELGHLFLGRSLERNKGWKFHL